MEHMLLSSNCMQTDGNCRLCLPNGMDLPVARASFERPFISDEDAKLASENFAHWAAEGGRNLGVAVGLRLGARLVDEAGEDGADGEVFDIAEDVDAEASVAVDDNQARGAAQPVAAHGDGMG